MKMPMFYIYLSPLVGAVKNYNEIRFVEMK